MITELRVGISHVEGIFLSDEETRVIKRWQTKQWLDGALSRQYDAAIKRSTNSFFRAALMRLFTGHWPIIVDVDNKV